MVELSTISLLHHGKCQDVYLSQDSKGNMYAVKRLYRKELEKRKHYTNVDGCLTLQDWFDDFCKAVKVQLMVQHDRCVKCIDTNGFDPAKLEKNDLSEELEMVLEYCECGSIMKLESNSTHIPSLPVEVIKCIAKDTLLALEYLSNINVAHCDIKPDNVFMDKNGRCKLGDFSHSLQMDSEGKVKGVKGSFYFMAPEMASGSPGWKQNDRRISESGPYKGASIDMWALGVSLWMLYFQRYPFKTLSTAVIQLMYEISNFDIEEQLEELQADGLHIEADFEDFIRSILCMYPSDRSTASVALVCYNGYHDKLHTAPSVAV
ncbi:hypothetical protein BgAZ_206490 [Babesia gibsoni]|uniref:Protein kinase domain-containing protein n=1 Tax=Babesia gibsoni TaxID=33632 RepID=A0AAD8LLI4_BABGI|nr:hypothetical protein BgAZ_206490 [Babesia gibsoni]